MKVMNKIEARKNINDNIERPKDLPHDLLRIYQTQLPCDKPSFFMR